MIVINTLNESELHKTLKILYAEQYNGKTEQKVNQYICDILTSENQVIEIQTANLGKLLPKILNLLETHKVILVYPLVTSKIIETHDSEGEQGYFEKTVISKRKSPKKRDIYDIFDELMGIWPLLTKENFSLHVVCVSITEIRIKTKQKIQSKNNLRRFKKAWIKTGKRLEKINETFIFSSPYDYLKLLPQNLPEIFCAKDLSNIGIKKAAFKIMWTLKKSELIQYIETKNRNSYWKKKEL